MYAASSRFEPTYGPVGMGLGMGGMGMGMMHRDLSGMMMAMMTELKMARMMQKLEKMLDD